MLEFRAGDINDLYVQIANTMLTDGIERNVRGFKTLELKEECCLILEDTSKSVVTLPARHLDERVYTYLEGEFDWFKSGDLSLEPIQPYAKFWNQLANDDFTINSNYGYYTFLQKTPEENQSQFDWCVKKLKEDNFTRQAIININQPMHKYNSNKDFCCTIGNHFLFRDGKLDCITWMRSNDLIFGTTYNFPWFTWVHRMVAEASGLEVGKYVHMVSSLHCYSNHFKMLKEIAGHKAQTNKKDKDIRKLWKDFTDGKEKKFGNKAWDIHSEGL